MAKEKPRYRSTFYFEGKRYECAGKSQKDADQKAAITSEDKYRANMI